MLRNLGTLCVLLSSFTAVAAEDGSGRRYAYYLFLADPAKGCEDCYVPLLVIPHLLDEVAASGTDATIVVITTYERDSVFTIERGVVLSAADIDAPRRLVRFRDRRYRYQEVDPDEVLRLLERPMGTIPIHRPGFDRSKLDDLISTFRGTKQGSR